MLSKQIFWILSFVFLCSCSENIDQKGKELVVKSIKIEGRIDYDIRRLHSKIASNKRRYCDIEELNFEYQKVAANTIHKYDLEKLIALKDKLLTSQQNIEEKLSKFKGNKELSDLEKNELETAISQLEQEIKYAEKVTSQETVSLHI